MPHNSYFHRRDMILNIINHLGPISRVELIDLTDYRPASVTAIIKELLDENLIIESGYSSTGHGRKRIMLEINKTHLCAIGISFFPKHVTYIVSQIDGKILHQDTTAIEPETPKDEIISRITAHVSTLLEAYQNKSIVGIGISEPLNDPAVYQYHDLISNHIHFNDWVYLNLKPQLEALSGLRVETYSGVAMPVIAEHRFGVAKGARDFMCIELSNGIGASIYCNGMPVVGAHGCAAELGHTVVSYKSPEQVLCYCGKPGCVEHTTAYPALVSQLKAALNRGVYSVLNTDPDDSGNISVQAIRKALDEHDQMCMYYVKEISTQLGIAIANAINLLNPEMIVLFGFMLDLGDYFLEQLETSIRANVFKLTSNFEIRTSKSTEIIFSQGAAAEIFSSYLKEENHKWIYQLQPSDLDDLTSIQDNLL